MQNKRLISLTGHTDYFPRGIHCKCLMHPLIENAHLFIFYVVHKIELTLFCTVAVESQPCISGIFLHTCKKTSNIFWKPYSHTEFI